MTDETEEDLATIAYMSGYHDAKRQWAGIHDAEIIEGIIKADPGRMDICGWSFEVGARFAEKLLKEKNT